MISKFNINLKTFKTPFLKKRKDICKAAKSSFPTQVPISQNPKLPGFQSFLDSYKENAINTTKAFQILEKILNTMCDKDENRPAVMSIFHALTTLNIKNRPQCFESSEI